MKLYDVGLVIVIITFIAIAIGTGSSYFFSDDNEVEEVCEVVIEATTGQDVDLSPESPEVKKTKP